MQEEHNLTFLAPGYLQKGTPSISTITQTHTGSHKAPGLLKG